MEQYGTMFFFCTCRFGVTTRRVVMGLGLILVIVGLSQNSGIEYYHSGINIKSSLVLLIIDSGIVTFLVCDNV